MSSNEPSKRNTIGFSALMDYGHGGGFIFTPPEPKKTVPTIWDNS
jgi:hypothetical protein